MITVVGAGYFRDSITVRGKKAIKAADEVVARSNKTPPCKKYAVSLDYLYETAENYDRLNELLAEEVIKRAEGKNLVYVVDGDGYKDSSVAELSRRTQISIIPGAFDLPFEPCENLVTLSAYRIDGYYPDTMAPLCVYGIDDRFVAGQIKLFLLRFYDYDTVVEISSHNGSEKITLEELDRRKKYEYDTAILIEGGKKATFADLCRTIKRLTAPDGCPWDKAQTHESIKTNFIEEAYEVCDAVSKGDIDGMIEELGDVLLQVSLNSDIAERSGEFTVDDVLEGINKKLISRHTHIFGGDKAANPEEALKFWDKAKAAEKQYSSYYDQICRFPDFPALMRAKKIFSRMKKVGVAADVSTLKTKISDTSDCGKLLFLAAAVCSECGVDAETELLAYCQKVKDVFEKNEQSKVKDIDKYLV